MRMDDLLRSIAGKPLASRGELAREWRTSPATMYRYLKTAERQGRIFRIGAGRATRYAARGTLPGLDGLNAISLYRVTPDGRVQTAGRLCGLRNGRTLFVRATGTRIESQWMMGERGQGCFEDLPFFLLDLRPQGFIGRQIARSLAGFPPDPRRWGAADIFRYLTRHGTDLPGDLLVGDSMADGYQRWRPESIRRADYPELAVKALAGEAVGSSAGGEQPKFLGEVAGRQVLVKFSPRGNDAVAKRWRDLLRAEHFAQVTLSDHNVTAVKSEVIDAGGRRFLEVERFDRVATRGRKPAISLEALDAEYGGAGSGWPEALGRLRRLNLVGDPELRTGQLLDAFAALIENTDRHLGNVTLHPAGDSARLTLAPTYDMLPMAHAPLHSDLRPVSAFRLPVQRVDDRIWDQAVGMAVDFWGRVAASKDVSGDFQEIAADRIKSLSDLVRRKGQRTV